MDQDFASGGDYAGAATVAPDVWHPPGFAAIMRKDVSALARPSDRFFFRLFAAVASLQIKAVHGLDNIADTRDPFILALNHSTFREWMTVPVILMVLRGGNYIHFLADWKLRPVPGIGFMMRRGKVILIMRKDSWPKWVNLLKRVYADPVPPFQQARAYLEAGASVGIFPEGDLTRDPNTLLAGRNGCARLSLETGTPVVPAGIRFPRAKPNRPIGENQQMEVFIGRPLVPEPNPEPSLAEVRAWHLTVMAEISRLSGKSLPPVLAARAAENGGATLS